MPSLLLLVGTPGSGKTHFSEYWCKKFPSYKRISQDDLGSRLDCEIQTRKYIDKGIDVIIDRCNFNKSQRKVWIDLARELNVYIDCIYLDIPIEVSKERILRRNDHPTQVQGYEGVEILEKFSSQFRKPGHYEGFRNVIYLKHDQLETEHTLLNSNIPEKTVSLIIRLLNRAVIKQGADGNSNSRLVKKEARNISFSFKDHNK